MSNQLQVTGDFKYKNDSGTLIAKNGEVNIVKITLQDFGAIGDGIADDTVAINNAITYAKTLTNAILYGQNNSIYRITNSIIIDQANIILDLCGSKILADFNDGSAIIIGNGVTVMGSLGIRNAVITTNNSSTNLNGVLFKKNVRRYIAYQNLYITNFKGIGLKFEELNWSIQGDFAPQISNCGVNLWCDVNTNALTIAGGQFYDADTYNIVLKGTFSIRFVGGVIQGADLSGVFIDISSVQPSWSITFDGVYFENNGTNHVLANGGRGLNIVGCYMNCNNMTGSAIKLTNWLGVYIKYNVPVNLSAGTLRDFVEADANSSQIRVDENFSSTLSDLNVSEINGSKLGIDQQGAIPRTIFSNPTLLNVGTIEIYKPNTGMAINRSIPYINSYYGSSNRQWMPLAYAERKLYAQNPGVSNYTPNLNNYNVFDFTIDPSTGLIINAPIGEYSDGDRITFLFKQNSIGNAPVTFNSIYKTRLNLSGPADSFACVEFMYSEIRNLWIETSIVNWNVGILNYNIFQQNITGNSTSYGLVTNGKILSDVNLAYIFSSSPSTLDTAFNLTGLTHFQATQGTIGTGSTISAQHGFRAEANLIGASNNYGFYGNIPSGANRWNLYMNGSANNFLNGTTLIGSTINSGLAKLQVTGAIQQSSVISSILKTDSNGVLVPAIAGSDYVSPSTLTSYVPYTGATQTVDLGSYDLNARGIKINGTGGLGHADFKHQSGTPTGSASSSTLYADINGNLAWLNDHSFTMTLDANANTADRTYTFPDANGTLALASDLSSYVLKSTTITTNAPLQGGGNLTVNRTLSITQATTSTDGYLSSIDWNTFNNKQNALINPVTGTGTTNTLPKFTGSTSIGNSNITDTGSLITLGSNSYVNGALGIGTSTLTGYNLRIAKNITGATTSYSTNNQSTIQSDVTTAAYIYNSQPSTAAASFTLGRIAHYYATQQTIGAGSTVTNQYGFFVENTLIGATNNYGFLGNIPAQANAWNIYMNGTANNYMAGSLFLGVNSYSFFPKFFVGGNATGGVNVFSNITATTIQSDVTSNYQSYRSAPSTQAASFTLAALAHYQTIDVSLGASSAVTSQYGFVAGAMTSATNNYGFYGNIASGTNRWNLYMNGTATNYMAGNTGIGTTTVNSFLNIGAGTTAKAQINLASSTAPTTPNDGDIWFDGTNLKMRIGGVTKTFTLI